MHSRVPFELRENVQSARRSLALRLLRTRLRFNLQNSLDRNVTFDLEEDLLTAKETLNLAKTRTSDDEVKTENKHKYELRSAEKKSGNLVKSLLDKKLTKSQKFDGPANWMKTTIRYSFLPETNFVRSNQKGAFSITKNDGLMVDEIGFGFSFKISESNLFSENKTEKNEKKLIQNMDKFAIELLNPKSAINYFLNQNFKREFGYLLQVPIEWRFPEIDPKTGKGGYVDSYEALGFYRKATFTEKSDRHIWFIDKVPLLKTQNFLQHQKTLLEKNKEFQNFFQIGKNEKIGKNKFKRAKNKYIWKRDRSNNDSLDQKKFENKKFTKSRFKSIPKKRIKKQMLSKKLSDIEKDNLLYETVLTAYSKEKYGNSMKLRSIEAKENEILKKLKEAKLQINIKSVENCENLKQIYFYKNKIKQLKKEILKIDNNHQINKIMENLSEELKTKSSTFQKNRKQEKWLKETELCQEHKQKLKEQNKMNNKRLCRIGEKVGTKICNGTAFVAVSWRDNDFCKEEVSWEHFDCCP
ncbi:hypothetical protein MHBO_001610 [Bonamia ostreae]|uniref:Uncharacterized protein n=1 Tax=Bonamia ostreae TaxID=126728 RepID=A0ABV2AJJ8_9EUKA